MSARRLLAELHRRDHVLAVTGWLNFGLFAAMLCIVPFDGRTVIGLNPWVKPMKFAFSLGLYSWTLAWLMGHLRAPRLLLGISRWGVSAAVIVEILCIGLQAARGTTSHFNISTPFDTIVFTTMFAMIMTNTVLAAVVLALFFLWPAPLPASYLWGIRLGIALFVLGSLEGFVMIANGAHTIGAHDGGPGLPFLNWSTAAGDLRVAHLLGLHSIQLLPLAGFGVSRLGRDLPAAGQVVAVFAVALLYVAGTAALFLQALYGRPLLGV